ncbi:hypothetical protein LOTGIDRAFT_237919 [Lottia gigantea]|uniref:Tumor protein p53-inducible nuclear protein 1 n=1 Tax=Lottia gigantea TaxID=225164 RepID=V4BA24_LOTGI|nr:hypothetical protein LOTGIDRAFT_237919 [Lottia gigantea]ESP02602.1 hypothetical protein LOTGIDRAFT_237919 [Lottia gigantea]
MLQSVTDFFFGSTETESTTPVDLKTKECKEGWIIVDVNDETQQEQQSTASSKLSVVMETDQPMSDTPEEDSSCPSETETDFGGSQSTSPESHSPSSRGHFKYRAKVNNSSESWIVTPPPCFAAKRKDSIVSEHPLENLLIEHPSMSVYNSICDSTVSEISMVSSVSSESMTEEEPVASRTRQQTQQEETQQVANIARRHQHQLVAPSSGLNVALDRVKGIRQHQRRTTRSFNRSHFERSNKSRDFQSCGKKQRQRNKNLCKSGALNARYGQR